MLVAYRWYRWHTPCPRLYRPSHACTKHPTSLGDAPPSSCRLGVPHPVDRRPRSHHRSGDHLQTHPCPSVNVQCWDVSDCRPKQGVRS